MASVAEKRGQYPDIIREGIGDAWSGPVAVVDVRTDAALPAHDGLAAILVTGSSHSVTEQTPWMKRAGAFIRAASEDSVPVLGLCFGHQLIADAFGGRVEKNPRGREIGTVRLETTNAGADDPLFRGLERPMKIQATHVDSVTVLPPAARIYGATSLDPHAAYAIGPNVRCVQLHPELDAAIIREYVDARAHLIENEGLSLAGIRDSIAESPDGPRFLQNFIKHFAKT